MPMWPLRLRMSRVRNTSRTRPRPLCMWKLWPSAVTMPAASCPRCWSTVMPSYSSWLTGLRATTPTMPHMPRGPFPQRELTKLESDPIYSISSWERDDLSVEAGALERGLGGFGGFAGGERARTQPGERATGRVQALGEVHDLGGGELVAGLVEL